MFSVRTARFSIPVICILSSILILPSIAGASGYCAALFESAFEMKPSLVGKIGRQISFSSMNRDLEKKLYESPVTSLSAHKLPSFAFEENLVNLLALSETIVEDLRTDPLDTKVMSTLSAEVLNERNLIGLDLLNAKSRPGQGITRIMAEELLLIANTDPVVGIEALKIYDIDPATGKHVHGFCFGRADFLYFELLKRGVPKNSIYKLFHAGAIYGDPNFGRPWSNHVVLIVEALEGGFYAIDPLYNKVMTPNEWYEANNKVAKLNRSMLYVGMPERTYTQGSLNTRQALNDHTFPTVRSRVSTPSGPVESQFIPKDHFWLKYYDDMIAAVLATNNGPYAEYFCKVSRLCAIKPAP